MHKLLKFPSKAGSSVNSSTSSINTCNTNQNQPQPLPRYVHNSHGNSININNISPTDYQRGYDDYRTSYDDPGRQSRASTHSSHSHGSSSNGYPSSKHSRSPTKKPSYTPPAPPAHHQRSSLPLAGNGNSSNKSRTGVFFVGATYLDTVMHVDSYLQEDSKKRATAVEQRRGGNSANSAEVLGQDPRAKVWFMSSMPSPAASSALLKPLEDCNVKVQACVHHSTHTVAPQSFIIFARDKKTRTIVSHSTLPDLTCEEFVRKFEMACISLRGDIMDTSVPFKWIHFEGRNIQEVVQMIAHVEAVYVRNNWRSQLTISVEFEKGDRPGISQLLSKADVCFFSPLYAETIGFDRPDDFLSSIAEYCKPTATLFCTWGARGAVGLHIESGTKFGARAGPVAEVVDTIGAGDTFLAGIILALGVRGYDIGRGMRFACHLASRKCGQRGFKNLVSSMPSDL